MRPLAAFLLAAGVTLAVTWPLRRLALRLRILDRPGPRKSHLEPVPYLGGVAVLLGVAIALPVLGHPSWTVLLLLAVISVVGLVDDLGKASVRLKVITETGLALAAVSLGFVWHFTSWFPLDALFTVVWIVGLTNSFNLLDNMDGLSSTVAATSLLGLAFILPGRASLAICVAGALLGFLYVNRPPAQMFLGDAGSLMIGYAVALSSIVVADAVRGSASVLLLACPVALAVFDTSLVIVSRRRSGHPIQIGGRDHFSHRLQLLGWSRGRILFVAFLVSVVGGASGYAVVHNRQAGPWMALAIAALLLTAWLRLLRVNPYGSSIDRQVEGKHV